MEFMEWVFLQLSAIFQLMIKGAGTGQFSFDGTRCKAHIEMFDIPV